MNEISYSQFYMHNVQFNNENGTFMEHYNQAYADGTDINVNSTNSNFHHNSNIEMNQQPQPLGSNQNCKHIDNEALIQEISMQI